MPWSSDALRDVARAEIERLAPSTVLDIGAGAGTWRTVYAPGAWTAVEIWAPYVDEYRLRDRYDHVVIGDARTVDLGGPYDLAIVSDVLEHVPEPRALLDRVRGVARSLIVQVPIGEWPQDDVGGNPHEAHVVTLEHADVVAWPGVTAAWHASDAGIALYLVDGLVTSG